MSQLTPEQKIQTLTVALKDALNTMEKGMLVRMQDAWPVLQAVVPESIAMAKRALNACQDPPEARYREPTQADVGRVVDVKVGDEWWPRKLLAILPESQRYRFVVQDGNVDYGHMSARHARIRCEAGQ